LKNNKIRKSHIALGLMLILMIGCSINQPAVLIKTKYTNEVKEYGKCRKFIKNGIPVVYLTGTPYEIGLAHGKLCKREIEENNKNFFDFYDRLKKDPQANWLMLSRQLEENIPEEYIDEMRGISVGADIEYDKILFINTLSTISMKNGCFAFAFIDTNQQIITLRQDDEDKYTDFHREMILYIVKPKKGLGFAAILTPGWVDGETGINEMGITVSQNNIGIEQKIWDVMPITVLSRYMLQYSETIDDIEKILCEKKAYPGRLIFASSKDNASVFEFVNNEKSRINMENGFLVLSNHARQIPSKEIGRGSANRLAKAENFLNENIDHMNVEKAIKLVRSPLISRDNFWDTFKVHNRQSYIFSPGTLDFWIAIPPESINKPASYGTYVGFNLQHELYNTGDEPNPKRFPAYKF
jgi:Acyl-coenzyme A:6-aminopenicillanic acid acyl-transferase